MAASTPTLPPSFIAVLAAGDQQIEKAARNLNRVAAEFTASFGSQSAVVPACRVLAAQGASSQAHVESHIGAAQWLLGVRLKEHLIDLVTALMLFRVFNAALASRAILETAAAAVHLQEKLEATMTVPSEDALRTALDELHRSVAGGRFDWLVAKDNTAMLKNLELYRAGEDPELPTDRRATSVLTMLRKLDQRVQRRFEAVAVGTHSGVQGGIVRAVYGMLSDICHPGTGTAILLSQPSDRDGWVHMKNATEERETRWFFGNLGLFVAPVADEALEALARMN